MKTIKAKVHRLPTEDNSGLYWEVFKERLITGIKPRLIDAHTELKPQYLYITTNEEIKEGDWYTWEIDGGTVFYQCKLTNKDELNTLNTKYKSKARKIIATTDPKLNEVNDKNKVDKSWFRPFIPKIPESFIEEYCKAGGIDEVDVEYMDVEMCFNYNGTHFGKDCSCKGGDFRCLPKLNPNNTIIIHPVEEKMYSRAE